MPKIGDTARTLPYPDQSNFDLELVKYLREIQLQLNGLAEGRLVNRYQAQTAKPTTGSYAQGDIIWKSDPVEAGVATAKYVVIGYICVASGSPGTLVEMRVLTGN